MLYPMLCEYDIHWYYSNLDVITQISIPGTSFKGVVCSTFFSSHTLG